MISTAQFNDFVKNAEVKWREGYNRVDMAVKELYDIDEGDEVGYTDELSQIDGYGYARRQHEGDQPKKGNLRQGYTLNLTQATISLEDEITWNMRRFDKYREINKLLAGMGEAASMRLCLDLTHQFTFGDSTSYVNMDGETINTATADGVALFSANHTITGGADVFSNLVAGAPVFSREALEAAELLFTKMINHNAVKLIYKPDTIITSDDPETCNAVKEFINSVGRPDSAERGKNPYHKKYKHIILPLLATDGNGGYDSTKTSSVDACSSKSY